MVLKCLWILLITSLAIFDRAKSEAFSDELILARRMSWTKMLASSSLKTCFYPKTTIGLIISLDLSFLASASFSAFFLASSFSFYFYSFSSLRCSYRFWYSSTALCSRIYIIPSSSSGSISMPRILYLSSLSSGKSSKSTQSLSSSSSAILWPSSLPSCD